MTKDNKNTSYKKFVMFAVGFFILVLGMTLTLAWWDHVVALLKGGIGMTLALGGLLMLYTLNK